MLSATNYTDYCENYTDTDEIAKLKEMLDQSQEEEPKEEVKVDKKELRRLTEILKDADVSNMEKNNMVRTIFKEIIKGGDGGKRLKCVFWRH